MKIKRSDGLLREEGFVEVRDLLENEKGLKHYYVCKPVIEIAQKIKIKGEADFSFLSPIANGRRQWSYDNHFFRWIKTDENIIVLAATMNAGNHMNFAFFRFSLLEEFVVRDEDEYTDRNHALFLQLLTFIELTDAEEVLVPPGRKNGTRKSVDGLKNDETFPVTIINSNWNKAIIRTEGFMVSGHLRLQPCGEGRLKRKLIFIMPFEKHGYLRKPWGNQDVSPDVSN